MPGTSPWRPCRAGARGRTLGHEVVDHPTDQEDVTVRSRDVDRADVDENHDPLRRGRLKVSAPGVGVVRCKPPLIAEAVVSTSSTPGAGNIA